MKRLGHSTVVNVPMLTPPGFRVIPNGAGGFTIDYDAAYADGHAWRPIDDEVLDILRAAASIEDIVDDVSVFSIAQRLNSAHQTINCAIQRLVDVGKIEIVQPARGPYAAVYRVVV